MRRTSRKPSNLSESLRRHLNAYALAASAAGAGVLALAQPAEAKIVYTKTHKIIESNSTFWLDLNHDGTNDFFLRNYFGTGYSKTGGYLRVGGYQSANSIFTTNGGDAAALRAGIRVGGKKPAPPKYLGPEMLFFAVHCTRQQCTTTFSGPWADGGEGVKNRYLGLKFVVKGKAHYGWARLSDSYDRSYRFTATLTGYAYETIANKPIITGKIKGPDVITLEPGSRGRLARGSAGGPSQRIQ